MVDAVSLIQNIYVVSKLIYDQAELAKANKSACKTLARRVSIIHNSLNGLESARSSNQYIEPLQELHEHLLKIKEFISQFNHIKWYVNFIKARLDDAKVSEFSKQLESSIQRLSLGLNAQQIINHEEDRKNQETFAKEFSAQQSEMYDLLAKEVELNNHFRGTQIDQQEVMQRQLQSLQQLLSSVAKNVKPGFHPASAPIDKYFMVAWMDIQFQEKIADGSFGKIYKAEWKGQPVVVKAIEGVPPGESAGKRQFVREVQIMSRLRSPYITQFYGASLEDGQLCILMEHMQKGSLYDVLAREVLSPEQQQRIALQIVRGLYFLHEQGVTHRDLKSANVLLDQNLNAKLTDFGLAQAKMASVLSIQERSLSLAWMAPETLTRGGGVHTPQSDVYSYGVLLWELVTGRRPYEGKKDTEIYQATLNNQRDAIPSGTPEIYKTLIQQCWHPEPDRRIDLKTIIEKLEQYVCRPASPSAEELYQDGESLEKNGDKTAAFTFFRRAADKNEVKSQAKMACGFFYGIGGCPKDKRQACQWFQRAALQGHVRSMSNLANMLEYGDGVEKDLETALTWYQAAADQNWEGAHAKVQSVKTKIMTQLADDLATVRPKR